MDFELWGFLDFNFDKFCRFAKMKLSSLLDRQELRLRQFFFQTEGQKTLYKMVLISDVLDHIGWINNPLNLGNMKIQKTQFVRNTALDKMTKEF